MKSFILTGFIIFSGLFSKAQVNMQAGSAEQSFPLINYTDGKAGLSLGIGLAYSSGNGLLVNDLCSDVGTGWSLDAGGIIVRVQNGEPDDQMEYNSGRFSAGTGDNAGIQTTLKNYPNGYMYNNRVGQGCSVGQSYYPAFKNQSIFKELNVVASDLEQDKFIFRMNGRSGVFVIGRDGKVTILGDSRIKVSFATSDMTSQGIRTTINQFVITTEDGIKYTFSEKSLSRICRYKYSTRDNSGNWYPISGNPNDGEYVVNRFWGYPLAIDERPYVVNSWFLSQIENTNNGQVINFSYQNISSDIVASKIVSHQRDLNNSGKVRALFANADRKRNGRNWYAYLSNPSNADNFTWNTGELNRLKPSATALLYNRSIINSKRISAINLPNGGIIAFLYNGLGRVDLPGENALQFINYSISGKLVRSYKLDQGYFFKSTIAPYNKSFSAFESKFTRLCLLSIQKIGNGDDNASEPPYTFTYFTGSSKEADDIVPARNYLSQDHWGYYNGSNATLSLTEDHDFLSQEQDSYFKTVLPQYKNAKNGYAKNGLLQSVKYPTGGTITYTYEQIKPSTNILPPSYTQLAGGVSVVKTTLFDGENYSKVITKEYKYQNSNNQSTHWGDEAPNYYSFSITEYGLKCFKGKSYKYPGLQFAEMATSVDWGKVIGKALINFAVSAIVQYGIAYGLTAIGAAAAIPYVNIAILIVTIVKIIIDCTKTYEYHRFILGNTNNILQNPLVPIYSSVEVRSNSPTGYNGKILYEFTDLNDYPAIVPKLEYPYIQNQRLASWVYGNPKRVSVYDKDNKLVNQSNSVYDYIVSKMNDNNNLNCKCATVNKTAMKSSDWEAGDKSWFTWGTHRWLTPRPYFISTGRTDLTSSTENTYANGILYSSEATNIIIDPMTLLQKGKVMLKDVRSIILQLSYYPTDFNIPGSAIEKLKERNAIHTPVSSETWLFKINGPNQIPRYTFEMIDANVTEFKQYTFGTSQEVKPWKTYKLKTRIPIPSTVIGTHNPSVLLRNPAYYKLESEMQYDNDGNLIQTNTNDNVTSFINDYSDRYVVASVTNASYSDIAYTSFESNGKGNWIFNSNAIQNNEGITGAKFFALNNTNTINRSGLNASKSYIVTYWIKNDNIGPVLINGQAGELLYQTGNWKLYKNVISGSSSVSISGTASIDELRLYPSNSLMGTVTYKEGIGKVSDCDANNRILLYEYDALGRLKLIRDQNRNVIKTYEYNYKQ